MQFKIGFEKDSLRVNINPLIPKLNTPYYKEINYYLEENDHKLVEIYKDLEVYMKKIPAIKIKFQNFKKIMNESKLQTIISLGDYDTSSFLMEYYNYGANNTALRKANKAISKITNVTIDDYLLRIKDGYIPGIIPWKI